MKRLIPNGRIVAGLSALLIPCGILVFYLLRVNRISRLAIGNVSKEQTKRKLSPKKPKIKIFYATCTGTAKIFADRLAGKLLSAKRDYDVEILDLAEFQESWLESGGMALFVVSTWTDGKLPENAQHFLEWLKDLANDFRVSKDHLQRLQFAVFGLGGKVYNENYCRPAQEIHALLNEKSATAIMPLAFGDDQSTMEQKFDAWSSNISRRIDTLKLVEHPGNECSFAPPENRTATNATKKPKTTSNNNNNNNNNNANSSECCASNKPSGECCGGGSARLEQGDHLGLLSDDEDGLEEEDRVNLNYVTMDMEGSDDEESLIPPSSANVGGCGNGDEAELDLEDLGVAVGPRKSGAAVSVIEREMVTKMQRKALTKEGYKIIGSHSAVKLCRWTKNQMRGRGGCYKHTFYGITSYQCMEATPSLACANKCVFCWRHHKNPVGTDWRWKTDEPTRIVDEAIELHQAMIREMKGVPGVLPERISEGLTVRHCALSLVGEPIMYPRINEMMKELHCRDISTFMVTNAQFPDKIKELDPVTQLYVSIDASTKDSLKAIDRPLFRDFWDRYLASLRHIADKEQRTVFRMTLVKDWNMNEAENYAELIEMGEPDFIEIKAVTFCGKSDASTLTMQNVPWHREVCQYSEELCDVLRRRGRSAVYSIATEHEHSCCILLAREDKFKVNGVWHTWIDYPRFHSLARRYYETGISFKSEDYMAPTPEWALYQSQARGFDPQESRWKRNKSGAMVEIEYKSSESGCG